LRKTARAVGKPNEISRIISQQRWVHKGDGKGRSSRISGASGRVGTAKQRKTKSAIFGVRKGNASKRWKVIKSARTRERTAPKKVTRRDASAQQE